MARTERIRTISEELTFLVQDKPEKTFHHTVDREAVYVPQCPSWHEIIWDENADLYYDFLLPWRAAGRP